MNLECNVPLGYWFKCILCALHIEGTFVVSEIHELAILSMSMLLLLVDYPYCAPGFGKRALEIEERTVLEYTDRPDPPTSYVCLCGIPGNWLATLFKVEILCGWIPWEVSQIILGSHFVIKF